MLFDFVSCLFCTWFFTNSYSTVLFVCACAHYFFVLIEDCILHRFIFFFSCLIRRDLKQLLHTQSIATLNSDTENNCWHTNRTSELFFCTSSITTTTTRWGIEIKDDKKNELKRGILKWHLFLWFCKSTKKYVLIFVIALDSPLPGWCAGVLCSHWCWLHSVDEYARFNKIIMRSKGWAWLMSN